MTPHLLPANPGHGKRLPSGREMARVLHATFRRQRVEVVSALRKGTVPDLARWAAPMAEAVLATGYPQRLIAHGAREALRQIGSTVHRGQLQRAFGRRSAFIVLKDLGGSFDVLNPRVLEAARSMVFNFCTETNDTATRLLSEALVALRVALAESYAAGEVAQSTLTERVQQLFADPMRAQRIALTESSRIVHSGELMAARDSGEVRGRTWLASADACPRCLALVAKGEVGLDEPFSTDGGKGPYRIVMHPPLHPW